MLSKHAFLIASVLVFVGAAVTRHYMPTHSIERSVESVGEAEQSHPAKQSVEAMPAQQAASPSPQNEVVAKKSPPANDQDELKKALKIFSDTPVGHSLAFVLVYSSAQNENSKDAQKLRQAIRYLEAKPQAAVHELTTNLNKIPAEYEESRRFLIQFSTRLKVDDSSLLVLMHKELERYHVAPDVNSEGSIYGPSISFEALMDVTDDKSILAREANAILAAHKNLSSAQTLYSRIISRRPDLASYIQKP